jgi:hypothetical protein
MIVKIMLNAAVRIASSKCASQECALKQISRVTRTWIVVAVNATTISCAPNQVPLIKGRKLKATYRWGVQN